MEEEKPIEKLYHTIGETAELLGLSTSQVRFWENEFDILRPKKNAKGDRLFTKDDIENLKLIHHLTKEKGYTIEGAKQQLKNKLTDEQKKFRMIEKLKEVKGFLNELKENLDKQTNK